CVLHPLTPAPCLSPFSCSPDPRHLPSFPTRRSSDLPSDVWASLAHTSPVRDRHPGDGRGGMTAWAGQARPCAMSEAIVPDSQHRGLVARLPQLPRDLAQLARFDRPIGWWLLFWPCAWGVWLTGAGLQWQLLLWLLLGAIAMRGAGCVYNDIVDADLDRQVARTASRPVASGRVSRKTAWAWLLALCAVGLIVLLQLRWEAQLVALASLALVAAYPFMKRITWWPQAWLGLVFTWGALVG